MIRHLALITLIYLLFVGRSLCSHSLFVDEFYTLQTVELDWFEIVGARASAGHPPLFFVLEKFWVQLFGSSDVAIRSLPFIFGWVAVLLFFQLARKFVELRLATLCTIFLITTPGHLFICQIARSYTLAESMILAIICLWIYFPQPWKMRFVVLFTLSAAAMLTHMSSLVHLNIFVAAAIISSPSRWKQTLPIVAGNIPLAVLSVVFRDLQSVPDHVGFTGTPDLQDVIYFPIRVLISNLAGSLPTWLVYLLSLAFFLNIARQMYKKEGQPLFSGILWITWFAAAFAAFLNIGIIRVARYFAVDISLIILVTAISFPAATTYLANRKIGMTLTGAASVVLFALYIFYPPFPDWRHIAQVAREQSTDNTCVVMATIGQTGNPARHYLDPGFFEPSSDLLLNCSPFERVIICGNNRDEVDFAAYSLSETFKPLHNIPLYRGCMVIFERKE